MNYNNSLTDTRQRWGKCPNLRWDSACEIARKLRCWSSTRDPLSARTMNKRVAGQAGQTERRSPTRRGPGEADSRRVGNRRSLWHGADFQQEQQQYRPGFTRGRVLRLLRTVGFNLSDLSFALYDRCERSARAGSAFQPSASRRRPRLGLPLLPYLSRNVLLRRFATH